jgi:hypothetical protein
MAWFLENRRFVMVQEVVPEVFVYFFECRLPEAERCGDRPRTVAVIAPTDLAEEWRFKNRNGFQVFDLFGNPARDDYGRKRSVIYAESQMPPDEFYERLRNVVMKK